MTYSKFNLFWLSVIQSDRIVGWLLSQSSPWVLGHSLQSCEMVTPGLPRLGSPSQTAWGRWAWSLVLRNPAGSGAKASLVPEGGQQLWRASLSYRLLLLHCVWTGWEGTSGESRENLLLLFSFLVFYLVGEKEPTFHWNQLIELIMRLKKERTKSARHCLLGMRESSSERSWCCKTKWQDI